MAQEQPTNTPPHFDLNLLYVKIISPKEEIYTGNALSVSSINSAGKFDILPQHANFVTMVQNVPITIQPPQDKAVTFSFPLAIIYSANNQVSIYTDIQIDMGEDEGKNISKSIQNVEVKH